MNMPTWILIVMMVSAFAAENAENMVWVSQPDGTLQCEAAPPATVVAGVNVLKANKIRVLESKSASDGQMHMALCGTPSGRLNKYKILKSDLQRAEKLGFRISKQ